MRTGPAWWAGPARAPSELEGVRRDRLVQCITLSKAFGVYGGAVLCSKALRKEIVARSRLFIGSTPLPLPLVNAARSRGAPLAIDTVFGSAWTATLFT